MIKDRELTDEQLDERTLSWMLYFKRSPSEEEVSKTLSHISLLANSGGNQAGHYTYLLGMFAYYLKNGRIDDDWDDRSELKIIL